VELVVLDKFASHALLNHKVDNVPAGNFIVLAPWYKVSDAARWLRVECLGSHLNPYVAAERHAALSAAALKIPAREPNDLRLPGCSKIRAGTLFRFDPETAAKAEAYFLFSPPTDQPVITELGAGACSVHVHSDNPLEPLRLIIADRYCVHTATRELTRWLKATGRHLTHT
jgi:hypothetical protein